MLCFPLGHKRSEISGGHLNTFPHPRSPPTDQVFIELNADGTLRHQVKRAAVRSIVVIPSAQAAAVFRGGNICDQNQTGSFKQLAPRSQGHVSKERSRRDDTIVALRNVSSCWETSNDCGPRDQRLSVPQRSGKNDIARLSGGNVVVGLSQGRQRSPPIECRGRPPSSGFRATLR